MNQFDGTESKPAATAAIEERKPRIRPRTPEERAARLADEEAELEAAACDEEQP